MREPWTNTGKKGVSPDGYAQGPQVLLVGQGFLVPSPLLHRLGQWGCRCQIVTMLREAVQSVARQDFDLVLSKARLPDGSAYQLISVLEGRPCCFFTAIELEEGSLWIPAIRDGKYCWGQRALHPPNLLQTLEEWVRERYGAMPQAIVVTQESAQ